MVDVTNQNTENRQDELQTRDPLNKEKRLLNKYRKSLLIIERNPAKEILVHDNQCEAISM